jgi:predicted secreted protein
MLCGALALALSLFAAPLDGAAQESAGERIKQQDTYTSSNVLTQGETDEWPLAARDNETVIIGVSSENFDPAVELLNPSGAVIARNDDIRAGEQDSLLLARLAVGGAYVVRVRASKAGGGRYELTVRRFIATDAPAGARSVGVLGKSLSQWHRFNAEAGQTLVVTTRAASFSPTVEIYAPSGEQVLAELSNRGSRAVFRAAQGGVYHARIAPLGNAEARSSYSVTIAPARVFQTRIGEANALRPIERGGLDLWTFKAAAGDLVKVQAKAAGGSLTAMLSFVPVLDKQGEPTAPESNVPPFVVLPSDTKASGELVALINTTGDYQVAVSQPFGLVVSYALATSQPVKLFTGGAGGGGTLTLGGSDYWAFDGKAGQILRYEAMSEQFDVALQLFNARGESVGADDDGASNRNAMLTALLSEPGRYLLRVYTFGGGGAGSYRLRPINDPARPLALNTRVEGTVGTGGSEIWSFKGSAGQVLIISARSSDFDTRIALYGPDAAEVAADDNGGEGTDSLLSVRLPVDGTYTLWVAAQGGGGAYALRAIEAQ